MRRPYTQYAHDVVLKSVQFPFNVMDVVWTSKRRRVLTGGKYTKFNAFCTLETRNYIKSKDLLITNNLYCENPLRASLVHKERSKNL